MKLFEINSCLTTNHAVFNETYKKSVSFNKRYNSWLQYPLIIEMIFIIRSYDNQTRSIYEITCYCTVFHIFNSKLLNKLF